MKNCQSCAKEINNDATKCKHCGEDQSHWLYEYIKVPAESTKIIIQMIIGFFLIIIIILHAVLNIFYSIPTSDPSVFIKIFMQIEPLRIVSIVLAYSAAVELAYMLFTPGPDEAVEPLIMGLASAILYSISSIDSSGFVSSGNLIRAVEISLFVFTLWALFYIKMKFIDQRATKKKKKKSEK